MSANKKRKMTESLDNEPGTSHQLYDPPCSVCAKDRNLNVEPVGYCHDCCHYLCKDCLPVHKNIPATSGHLIRTGDDMPKSQADKWPRSEYWDVHHQKSVPETLFPVSPSKLSQASAAGYQPSGNTEQIKEIKAQKCSEYNINLPDDAKDCEITGLAVTLDGRRLLADFTNKKIKMFSRDMKIISSLSLPGSPWDIAVTGDKEAVFSVLRELFILDVSDQQMSVRRTMQLSFGVWGIATYKNRLVVTSPVTSPPSVKLIDQRGKIYWSTSTDQQGQRLFSSPWHVSCYDEGRSSTVIVTDHGNNTLTLFNSDTGGVISRRQVEWKGPRGVTTDHAGNIYVSYWWTEEVAVLAKELSEEKILLTQPHSYWAPAIAYDTETDKLVVIHDLEDE